jgi:hypothetical protein
MLGSYRFAKTIATSLCAALAAYAVTTGLAEKDAQAQISGTIGGDAAGRQPPEGEGILDEGIFDEGIFFGAPPSDSVLVTAEEIANAWVDGTSNTIMVGYTVFLPDGTPVSDYSVAVSLVGERRVRIAADVTIADPASGTRRERITAVLIGPLAPQAPGFMDYTDDACRVAAGGAPSDAELRACAFVSHTFRAFMQERRLAVSPRAVMAQTADGIAIWEPR